MTVPTRERHGEFPHDKPRGNGDDNGSFTAVMGLLSRRGRGNGEWAGDETVIAL